MITILHYSIIDKRIDSRIIHLRLSAFIRGLKFPIHTKE
jgi:hypothetical protein